MKFTITPDAAFSLEAAAAFGFGPNTGRPKPDGGVMRLAFVADDLRHHAGVLLTQDPGGTVTGEAQGDAGADVLRLQVSRILSLDHPGREWLAVGERDPVIGRLQRELPGFRPVLFHSPYEAAAWSIISVRRQRTQAANLRTRIAASLGRTFTIGGEQVHAFPLPGELLGASAIPGVEPARLERLHGIARAALDGMLEPQLLRAMEPEQALQHLQRLHGVGPTYAGLILLRSTGVTDTMTFGEPRLPGYLAQLYDLGPQPATREQIELISDQWRPFRTWSAVLVRAAGDRMGLPFGSSPPGTARASTVPGSAS